MQPDNILLASLVPRGRQYQLCLDVPVVRQQPTSLDSITHRLEEVLVIRERPAALRKVALDVPAPCADIAMKALEKKRRDRYQSAGAMESALLKAMEGHILGQGQLMGKYKRR